MICPKCNVLNEDGHSFCVNCGTTILQNQSGRTDIPPTVQIPSGNLPPPQNYTPAPSIQTSVLPQYQHSDPTFQQQFAHAAEPPKRSNTVWWIGGIFLIFLLLGGGGTAAYLVSRNSGGAEVLPGHFGLFSQNQDKNAVNEIKKQDFTSLLTAKEDFAKNDSLPVLEEKPNLILFAENNDIPLNDLKLVQLDSIKDDGTLKQLDFQAAPVEGRPEMKRMRVPESLAIGKYAFALFDGYLEEGKHKLWAFQIKTSSRADNGEMAKNATLPLKPKDKEDTKDKSTTDETVSKNVREPAMPTNTHVPTDQQPSGSKAAYLTQGNVVMRSGPSQNTSKIGGFRRGQKVYVLSYSDNYEYFNNLYSNYAYVQTESGKRGWVYAAFVR